MIAKGEKLLDYIPQRPPFVMIDTLEEATGQKVISGFLICPENIFVDQGCLREPGIIENMAQTAAAGFGYFQKKQGLTVKLGFIAAIRNLSITTLPKVGQTIKTSVDIVNEIFDITIINAKVYVDKNLAADCEMRIYLQNSHVL